MKNLEGITVQTLLLNKLHHFSRFFWYLAYVMKSFEIPLQVTVNAVSLIQWSHFPQIVKKWQILFGILWKNQNKNTTYSKYKRN